MAQYYDINKLLDDLPSLALQNKAQNEQSRQFDKNYELRQSQFDKDYELRQGQYQMTQDMFNRERQQAENTSKFISDWAKGQRKQHDYSEGSADLRKGLEGQNAMAWIDLLTGGKFSGGAPRGQFVDVEKQMLNMQPKDALPEFENMEYLNPQAFSLIQTLYPNFGSINSRIARGSE